ncbi:DNA-binding protein [Natranaeroarchaeum aerophilus]|uniref:DNA-binding protein AArcSt11_01790 n=1 Tax=Natranaeroarchaeum aerophilus TaxID=2917711 RepID=A0AAE3K3B3_9EURY|nr:DNA-binding protein [Natranaeroarchaeum aerophilus]MCL9812383.1 DNA-binding protein [Natranaeroarchaeum aerophilus]
MSGNPDEDRLDEIRQKKMEQLKEQQQGEGDAAEAQQARQEQADAQKQAMLRQHLTDGARKRLNTVKMSKPDFGEKVERQVVALAQSGRVQGQIDEDQMKDLLEELKPDSQSFNIRRR